MCPGSDRQTIERQVLVGGEEQLPLTANALELNEPLNGLSRIDARDDSRDELFE